MTTLYVNDYFEYFFTLLGWVINNNIWNLMVDSGAFAIPLVLIVVREWLKVREEGDDEGNKGVLLMPRLEHHLYSAFLVILIACIPSINIAVNTIPYDVDYSLKCGYKVIPTEQTKGFQDLQSSIGNQSPVLPPLWAFTATYSKAITQSAVTSIPCKPDLRQLSFDIKHTKIKDPILRDEYHQFYQQCYVPAKTKLRNSRESLSPELVKDTDWAGSHYFLKTNGFYNYYHAKQPNKRWIYDYERDKGLPNTGAGGYPTCEEWWSDASSGLKERLLDQFEHYTKRSAGQILGASYNDWTDQLVRSMLSNPESITVSSNQAGQASQGYGGELGGGEGWLSTTWTALKRVVSSAGVAVVSGTAAFGFDALRQALPMVQAILIMAFTICIPFVLLFSGYKLQTLVTLIAIQFSIYFLTFWWELARWIDSNLTTALYSSDTHSRLSTNIEGIVNIENDFISNLIMGMSFIFLPIFWVGAMTWAGHRVGNAITNTLNKSTDKTQKGGDEGGEMVKTAAKKGVK
ncbi:conjugal transfer protein TraG [Mergibacter septicus]|uniref:Conjugal transfer protein TraG n=1 Tax=Mergibacter septicus TaxID=221402 RepID=A0A8D4LLK8_9PAST|nr:conjugal transfer protein TraG N-terminal domain-containing protein [Mergibacter septicus]AWX14722.1 conjugal transfer protein TraG [Mergibacter septicus]QDJ13973.1 conjugal transfer protein TraG [Mergibacter septicus]UTU48578.1 conjugal transfer protein TraG N-terminal domain-containing protein [Mergibacter septicus]WMR95791.1 conjugal transfer protein TraG N-terminal domain-containing protein [Mergibacter septicus]